MLAEADKPRSVDDYDRLVSAEIPDPENEQLYQTVRMCMMHGPCGRSNPDVPCMKDGVCSKRFPKNFTNETKQADDGYPVYRRRNDGRTVTVKGVHLDNRYVVPYNPWLCHKYDCHICLSVASIKYLYKYVYKGHDRVVISPSTSLNEIQEYLDARYISASQAMAIIFGFEIQAKTVTVVVLPIHLENQQGIVFNSNENIESVIERGGGLLTRFFQLMANDPSARNLTYQELPTYFRYAKPTQRLPWHEGSGCQ